MFGQSLIAGKIVEEIAKACGASKEDAKAIRKTVVWGTAILTADATGALLDSAAEGAMIEAGFC